MDKQQARAEHGGDADEEEERRRQASVGMQTKGATPSARAGTDTCNRHTLTRGPHAHATQTTTQHTQAQRAGSWHLQIRSMVMRLMYGR